MALKLRWFTYFIACFCFSIGAKFFICSNLGVDPLDCLVIGLAHKLDIMLGTASAFIAVFFLFLWSVWNKRIPVVTPFATMTLVGYLIDFWNYLIPNTTLPSNFYTSWVLMLTGLLICSYASSLIIMSGIGIRTMDLVAITMTKKLKFPFFIAKGVLEAFFIITGVILSGPFGIGTFAFLFLVGPLIQPFILLNTRYLRLVDYGLQQEACLF